MLHFSQVPPIFLALTCVPVSKTLWIWPVLGMHFPVCLPTLEQLDQSQTTSRALSASDIYRDEPALQGADGGLSGSMAVSYFTECKPLHLNRNALHFGKMQRPLLWLFNKS